MDKHEQKVRQMFSQFALQLYHLGYNFVSFNNRGVTRWTVTCENTNDELRIDYEVKTGKVKVITKEKEKLKYDNLEELHKVLLYKAGVEHPQYTKSTETVITLLNITNGLLPLSFKTKSLFFNLTVFDLHHFGKIQNIFFQSRGTTDFVVLDNNQVSLQSFVERVFPQRPVTS